MRCVACGGRLVPHHGTYEADWPFVGPIVVDDLDYLECDRCHEKATGPEAGARIDAAFRATLERLVRQYPLDDFWEAGRTAWYLGISEQALSKHRRIRRGFIFQTKVGKRTVYLRQSVERFREHGDGRYDLCPDRTGAESMRFVVFSTAEKTMAGRPPALVYTPAPMEVAIA